MDLQEDCWTLPYADVLILQFVELDLPIGEAILLQGGGLHLLAGAVPLCLLRGDQDPP